MDNDLPQYQHVFDISLLRQLLLVEYYLKKNIEILLMSLRFTVSILFNV